MQPYYTPLLLQKRGWTTPLFLPTGPQPLCMQPVIIMIKHFHRRHITVHACNISFKRPPPFKASARLSARSTHYHSFLMAIDTLQSAFYFFTTTYHSHHINHFIRVTLKAIGLHHMSKTEVTTWNCGASSQRKSAEFALKVKLNLTQKSWDILGSRKNVLRQINHPWCQ